MSTGGQVVGGVVGAVAGFIGSGFNPAGALWGAHIAMIAGEYLAAPPVDDEQEVINEPL